MHALVDAVRSGALGEKVLDRSVSRILSTIYMASKTPKGGSFDVESHHDLAARAAGEGMVLLKNNGILPLKDHGKVAVIGLSSKHPYFQGGGASRVNPTKVAIPRDELRRQAPGTRFTYADGYTNDGDFRQDLIDEATGIARSADTAILFIALPPLAESEGYDRMDIDLPRQQVALIQSVTSVQPNTVVVLNNGRPSR